MIRRHKPSASQSDTPFDPTLLRARLTTRRQFLIQAAGGSIALLFGPPGRVATADFDPWPTLDAVLVHLLPDDSDTPGALQIHAPDYLRFVVGDSRVDAEERAFILQGAGWLDELAHTSQATGFAGLASADKERLLRQVAESRAGENWISTLLTYLFEALLTAPAYGGNPQGVGWRWLQIVPGFPLPGPGSRYPELPL